MNNLNFIEENPEQKKVLIFLHPLNLSLWIWNKQFKEFNNFNNIFIDLPNHGKSNKNFNFEISKTVDILKEFILELNKEEINFVGIGLGGQIAIEFISKYPNLINKVIVSGVQSIDEKSKESYETSIVQILNKTKKILDSKSEDFLALAYLRYYGIGKEYYEYLFKNYLNQDYENLKRISYENLNYSLNKKPKDKSKEILVCFGSYDTIWVKSSVFKIKKIYTNVKPLKIENATHLWNIRKYKLFNKLLKDYFKY